MIQRILKRLTAFIGVLFLCAMVVFGGQGAILAQAEESTQTYYESTNVLDNLKGATIGGKTFDIADYPHDENGRPQVLSFVEFCYSYYAEKQNNFGLYVYVYNPQDREIDVENERNKIQFTYGDRASYSKYNLDFLNYSTEVGVEGRFYKFKVRLSDDERKEILKTVNGDQRVYKVSGIELCIHGKVTEYTCAQTYTYKGFAEGYGSELATGETLSCVVDGFDKYLSLDVRSTYYRPKGTNGGAYEQDTLHSVYFSVPNEIIAEYGDMTAVHATWLNAKTNPIFVTGNSDIYNAVLPYIGKKIDGGNFSYAKDDDAPLRYSLIASKYIESASWNGASYGLSYMSYNENEKYTNSDTKLTTLYYAFLAENGDADNYTLPAEMLVGNKEEDTAGYFETYSRKNGGVLLQGKYSQELFAEVASAMTDITISKDEKFELTDEVVSQSLWQQFVGGGYKVDGKNTYTVSAIKKVGSSDFKSNKTDTCKGLYIDESDYEEFKSYYNSAKNRNETVYLFRYYQSTYTSYETVEYKRGKGDWTLLGTQFGYDYVDTNAYLMQMWVQLDFDIIDLTFTKDGVATVIPAVMSPKDLAADATPPVITNPEPLEWWQILLGIIGMILLIWFLIKFGFRILVWLICLPFKLIGLLFKGIFKRRKKRCEKESQESYQ